jgi:hypothetical protein
MNYIQKELQILVSYWIKINYQILRKKMMAGVYMITNMMNKTNGLKVVKKGIMMIIYNLR